MLSRPSGRYRRFTARFAAQCAGQATVEFALVILFGLLPMVFGAIEIGRTVWYYNQLSQLSREGARALIVSSANFVTAGDATTQKRYVLPGNWPGTYTVSTCGCGPETAVGWIGQMDVGIPREQLTVAIAIDGINASDDPALEPPNRYTYGKWARVTVRYPHQPLVATFLGIPATITLEARTEMQMQ